MDIRPEPYAASQIEGYVDTEPGGSSHRIYEPGKWRFPCPGEVVSLGQIALRDQVSANASDAAGYGLRIESGGIDYHLG